MELLIRPRVEGDADSVVYTIEPVNSPPTEKPWIRRMVTSSSGRRHANLRIGRQQAEDERRSAHQGDGEREQRAAADAITDHAERQAADRARAEPEREHREG